MRFVIYVALAVLISGGPLETQAQEKTITLGLTTLRLGMSEELVQKTLSRQYVLRSLFPGATGPVESFVVWEGNIVLGNVPFRDGRLSSVFKQWCPADKQKGIEYAQKFYAAVASLIGDGHRSCVLEKCPRTNQTMSNELQQLRVDVGLLRSQYYAPINMVCFRVCSKS